MYFAGLIAYWNDLINTYAHSKSDESEIEEIINIGFEMFINPTGGSKISSRYAEALKYLWTKRDMFKIENDPFLKVRAERFENEGVNKL